MKPLTFFAIILASSLFLGRANIASANQPVLLNETTPTIQVVVHATTWKTRGRLLYDIEGSVLKKLSLAGFQAVHDAKKPHQYQLVIQYDEERGAQYGVELWGTTIHVSFFFRGTGMAEPLRWEIRETSANTISGPAPYLDALLKFETHPHYFFMGTMLKRMTKGVNVQSIALTQAVKEFVSVVYPTISEGVSLERGRIQDHFMDNSERVYQEVALQRALDELEDQGIPVGQLSPIAARLLDSTDPYSRIRAVTILGRTKNAEFLEKIQKLATDDPTRAVRNAAQQFAPL